MVSHVLLIQKLCFHHQKEELWTLRLQQQLRRHSASPGAVSACGNRFFVDRRSSIDCKNQIVCPIKFWRNGLFEHLLVQRIPISCASHIFETCASYSNLVSKSSSVNLGKHFTIITVNGSELSQLCLCQKCRSIPTIPNVPPFSWVKRGVKLCESWVPHFLSSFSHGPWFITVYNFTISIAQGGGGSFKNRKPIGEVGCCESRRQSESTDGPKGGWSCVF